MKQKKMGGGRTKVWQKISKYMFKFRCGQVYRWINEPGSMSSAIHWMAERKDHSCIPSVFARNLQLW